MHIILDVPTTLLMAVVYFSHTDTQNYQFLFNDIKKTNTLPKKHGTKNIQYFKKPQLL